MSDFGTADADAPSRKYGSDARGDGEWHAGCDGVARRRGVN